MTPATVLTLPIAATQMGTAARYITQDVHGLRVSRTCQARESHVDTSEVTLGA